MRAIRRADWLRSPTAVLAGVVVVALVALAVVGPLVWGHQAAALHPADLLEPHSGKHLLGTDNLGRDLFARVMVAARLSLELAVLAVLVAVVIGVPLGALPSVLGQRGARITAMFIEFSIAFPALLLVIFLGVVLGVGAHAAVLAIGIASAPSVARLTQTLSASVAESDYVGAARVLGVSRSRILVRHVLPNIAEPIILNITIAVGYALLAMSGLSFLGLGVQPPAYDWGRLLDQGLTRIYVAPEAALGPAVAIVIAGLAFNGLGEAMAEGASKRIRVRRSASSNLPVAGADGSVIPASNGSAPLLAVRDLTVTFPMPSGLITPVRGVSFAMAPGERLGIVGESASGKSLTALAIAQLVPYPGRVTAAALELDGHDLTAMSSRARKRLLGRSLAMVFQDPATSLNPALRVGRQLTEAAETSAGLGRAAARDRAVTQLRRVRLSRPERRLRQYPRELSGGMRQRVMIAMGLMAQPRLIIADEPTSSLDVTVQQQIVRLLQGVSAETGASVIFISHDIAVVAQLCHRVLVMYAGRIVEDLDVEALRTDPAHPYTRALVASIPDVAASRSIPLATIDGRPPDASDIAPGCAFAPRCPVATQLCHQKRPPLQAIAGSNRRLVACWHPQHAQTPSEDAPLVQGARR
jgi:oligopeptide/dipeptide ABC transporter ATP-binding protein